MGEASGGPHISCDVRYLNVTVTASEKTPIFTSCQREAVSRVPLKSASFNRTKQWH